MRKKFIECAMKAQESPIPARVLDRWESLTESNAHGQRLEEVARFFAAFDEKPGTFDELAERFAEINRQHDADRSISPELYEKRRDCAKILALQILVDFGPETLKAVQATA